VLRWFLKFCLNIIKQGPSESYGYRLPKNMIPVFASLAYEEEGKQLVCSAKTGDQKTLPTFAPRAILTVCRVAVFEQDRYLQEGGSI